MIYLGRHAAINVKIFVFTLILIPFLALALPDLLFGGIRSFNSRYLVATSIGLQLAIAYLLGTQLASSVKTQGRRVWQFITLAVLGCGLISCIKITTADTWWNKYYAAENVPVAEMINQVNQPLLLIEAYWLSEGNLYSLSHFLESDVKVQLFPEGQMIETLPDGFSNVFLLNPSKDVQQQVERAVNYESQSVYEGRRFSLWQLEIPLMG